MGCEKRIETTTREIRVYTCDVCGAKSPGDQCPLCKRYLCHLHVAQWDQPVPDDFGTPYCASCWEAGAEVRQALEALDSDRDERTEKRREGWKTAAAARLKGGAVMPLKESSKR